MQRLSLLILILFLLVSALACNPSSTQETQEPASNTAEPTPERNLELRPGLVASLMFKPPRGRPQHFTLERKTEYSGTNATSVHYVIKLNEFEVAVINERYVDLEPYIQLTEINRYVVILSVASGGSGCLQKLVLISFDESRLIESSPQFGNCHEDPTFISDDERLVINFPHGKNSIDQSWTYDESGLRQTK
jgi:hypothetical protein